MGADAILGCAAPARAVLEDRGLGGRRIWVKEPSGERNKVEQFAS